MFLSTLTGSGPRMIRIVQHLRRNLVAYVALFVALGGTSYAVTQIQPGSVGDRQLRNHSINPVKLNHRYIGGYVRAWATVDSTGHVVAASNKPKVQMVAFVPPGHYIVVWNTKPKSSCEAVANVDGRGVGGSGALPGFAVPETTGGSFRGQETSVTTFNAQGQAAALPFDVTLICSTPR